MSLVSQWLENEFLIQAKKISPYWGKAETESINALLICDSLFVHDGVKAGQCTPGTIEGKMRLEIAEGDKEPVINTQYMLLGCLTQEELMASPPTSDATEKFLREINQRYSKALLSKLNQIGKKKMLAVELMPHDLLIKQNPARLLAKCL